jgi:hypothetical protein
MTLRVEVDGLISIARMAAVGASFSLPHLPAKVSSLEAERPLSLGGANWPSYPKPDRYFPAKSRKRR